MFVDEYLVVKGSALFRELVKNFESMDKMESFYEDSCVYLCVNYEEDTKYFKVCSLNIPNFSYSIHIEKRSNLDSLAISYIKNYKDFLFKENLSSLDKEIFSINYINENSIKENSDFLFDLIYHVNDLRNSYSKDINVKEEAKKLISNVMALFTDVAPEERALQAEKVIETKKCYVTPNENIDINIDTYSKIIVDSLINLFVLEYFRECPEAKKLSNVKAKVIMKLLTTALIKLSNK